jgi:hypothetical protein
MAVKIVSAVDMDGELNAIVYGRSSAGKTHLLGTAQEIGRTLVVDFDRGASTLRGVSNVDIVRPNSWAEIQDVYRLIRETKHGYAVVALDSLTECMKKHSTGHVMGELNPVDDSYVDLARAVTANRNEWGRVREQMQKLIRAFRDLAYLRNGRAVIVIMTALERYSRDESTFSPHLMGSLSLECGALVDAVLRLSRQESQPDEHGHRATRRYLLTDEHTDMAGRLYMAKNRGNRLPKGIWEPSLTDIVKGWRGEGFNGDADESPDEFPVAQALVEGDPGGQEEEKADGGDD